MTGASRGAHAGAGRGRRPRGRRLALLAAFLALSRPLPAAPPAPAPDEEIQSITIRVTTPDPATRPDPDEAAYGATSDPVYLDLGGVFGRLGVPRYDEGAGAYRPFEHAHEDTFLWSVPQRQDSGEWLEHHTWRRLPAGLRVRDLSRCRLLVDHGRDHPGWFAERLDVLVNGKPFVKARVHRWLGDEFGLEWDTPVPRAPAPAGDDPVVAARLDLVLIVAGAHPWRLEKPGTDYALVFNLGGISWRLDDFMVENRHRLSDARSRWSFRLPLDEPLRASQVRVLELFRSIDHPFCVPRDGWRPPEAACSVEGLELISDGALSARRAESLLTRRVGDRFFYFREPFLAKTSSKVSTATPTR